MMGSITDGGGRVGAKGWWKITSCAELVILLKKEKRGPLYGLIRGEEEKAGVVSEGDCLSPSDLEIRGLASLFLGTGFE
jgi:hypothetical protein